MSTSFKTSYCSSTRRTACRRIAFNCSGTDKPSGPACTAPASNSSLRLATRISKNSSRMAQEMHKNRTRSSSGMLAILGLLQHALIEFQKRQLAVEIQLRNL